MYLSVKLKKNMSKFGWDLEELEREKKLVFVNVSPVRVVPTEKMGLIQLGMKEYITNTGIDVYPNLTVFR